MIRRAFILVIAINLSACAHQAITWDRAGSAAKEAAIHPSVWAPLLGAGIFSLSDLDQDTSKSLSELTPVFGDARSATKASNDLRDLLVLTAVGSALVAPESDTDIDTSRTGDRLAVVVGGLALTGGITESIKKISKRERPNKTNTNSFPSGHASAAFASATFASQNFHRIWGDDARAQWADAGLYTTASLTALARVEAEKHYPGDVLAGAALGNFMARFLDKLFLQHSTDISINSFYDGRTVLVGLEKRF